MKTAQQVQNLRDAAQWWPTIPVEDVRLSTWACGTTACFGGWCTKQPSLRAQGLESYRGAPMLCDPAATYATEGVQVAARLFGDWRMFTAAGGHPADDSTLTDHDIVSRRIQWELKGY